MESLPVETAVKSITPTGSPWELARRLRCRLSVDVPIPGFTVRDLLRLEKQAILETQMQEGTPVPVQANGESIARGEFDVIGMRLAVRILEIL